MRPKFSILISPGLNEGRDEIGRILSTVRIPNTEFVLSHASQWDNRRETTVEPKIERMKKEITELRVKGRKVVLAGVSASGSLVGNTAIECWDNIEGVVIYSGRLKPGGNLLPFPPLWLTSFGRPAFRDSVERFAYYEPKLTDKQRGRFLIFASKKFDELVPFSTATILRARIKELHTFGHTTSIKYALKNETASLEDFIGFLAGIN